MGWDDERSSRNDSWNGSGGWSDTRDDGGWGGRSGGGWDSDWPADPAPSAQPSGSPDTTARASRTESESPSSGVKIAWITAGGALIAALIAAITTIWVYDPPNTALSGDVGKASTSIGTPCCTFSVPVEGTGFEGETLTLESTVVDNTTGLQGEPDVTSLTMTADRDKANPDVVLDITRPGYYYVVYLLRDPNGTTLDREQSEPFPVGMAN